jgi:hypothetical protein
MTTGIQVTDAIVDPDGVRPRIWFQPVPDPEGNEFCLH